MRQAMPVTTLTPSAEVTVAADACRYCLSGEHPEPFDHHASRDGCAFRSETLSSPRSMVTFFCAMV